MPQPRPTISDYLEICCRYRNFWKVFLILLMYNEGWKTTKICNHWLNHTLNSNLLTGLRAKGPRLSFHLNHYSMKCPKQIIPFFLNPIMGNFLCFDLSQGINFTFMICLLPLAYSAKTHRLYHVFAQGVSCH